MHQTLIHKARFVAVMAAFSVLGGCAGESQEFDAGSPSEEESISESDALSIKKIAGIFEGVSTPDGTWYLRERLTIRADRTFSLRTDYSKGPAFGASVARSELVEGTWRRSFLGLGGGDIRLSAKASDVGPELSFETRLIFDKQGDVKQVGAFIRNYRFVCAGDSGCKRIGTP